jgi:hypothetical protein
VWRSGNALRTTNRYWVGQSICSRLISIVIYSTLCSAKCALFGRDLIHFVRNLSFVLISNDAVMRRKTNCRIQLGSGTHLAKWDVCCLTVREDVEGLGVHDI